MKIRNLLKYSLLVTLVAFIVSCAKTDSDEPATTRDNFVGTWTCVEKGASTATYKIAITADATTTDGILIKNFFQLGDNTFTKAIVDGNYITIPQQSVSGWALNGNGTYNTSNATIHFAFTANDGQGSPENVTADCHK